MNWAFGSGSKGSSRLRPLIHSIPEQQKDQSRQGDGDGAHHRDEPTHRPRLFVRYGRAIDHKSSRDLGFSIQFVQVETLFEHRLLLVCVFQFGGELVEFVCIGSEPLHFAQNFSCS